MTPVRPGTVSRTTAPVTSLAPLLETVTVYVTGPPPAGTLLVFTDLATERSTGTLILRSLSSWMFVAPPVAAENPTLRVAGRAVGP